MSSDLPPVMPSNVVPFPSRLSSGKRLDLCSGQAFDLHGYYAGFNDRWMALMHKHFDSPAEVAAHFKTTERAAAKWWDGIGGPHGGKVAVALMTLPGAGDDLRAVSGGAVAGRRAA